MQAGGFSRWDLGTGCCAPAAAHLQPPDAQGGLGLFPERPPCGWIQPCTAHSLPGNGPVPRGGNPGAGGGVTGMRGRKFILQRVCCGPGRGRGSTTAMEGLGGEGCRGETEEPAHHLCCWAANKTGSTAGPRPLPLGRPSTCLPSPGVFFSQGKRLPAGELLSPPWRGV